MEKRGKGRPRNPVPSVLADQPKEVQAAFWRDFDDPAIEPALRERLYIVGPSTSAVGWLIARNSLHRHLP